MKKILLMLAGILALTACDPEQENISNDGSITVDQLKSMSTVTVDKAASGLNGNFITCTTSAPVNAKWSIGGKEFIGNYAEKKMKVGDYTVTLTGLCADGTLLTADFAVSCQEITKELNKYIIYDGPAFTPGAWDAAAMRFSDNEGRAQYGVDDAGNPLYTNLPYLSDEVYFGKKTLIFELSDVSADCDMKVMNGWWSATYYDHVKIAEQVKDGKWELQLTDDIALDCARGNGGSGKDLDLMLYSGSMTVHSVYYEE